MPDSARHEEEIFETARKLTDTTQRIEYLESACADVPQLRDRMEKLLIADAQADMFFTVGAEALDQPVFPLAVTEVPGDRIGRYKLLQKIGEGGCGLIYMAEQEKPVRRRVALKIIKLGMDTRNVVARFEAERQALAMMDHPNIAAVYDGGETGTGRPYFVMELVRGTTITQYCDENHLTAGQRLELFVQISHAVQHAHQKGVIHRDLKPSNILVTINDGIPVPKVIDFGIAKAIEGRLTDQTLFTVFEQFLGTPAYMSPEQAVMTSVDVDTRSDIYSLGVLLYELLTGKTPFESKMLLAAGLDQMRRTILEKEPLTPSNRLQALPEQEITTAARNRRSDGVKLLHTLRGDLDWIVMKCLEKDRARRYQTANDLALDLERYLRNEPVLARPPTNSYRLRKLIHRNKLAFAAGAGVAAALIVGTFVSTLQAVRARRAEFEQHRLGQLATSEARNARNAEAEMREKLRGSYLAEAQALRWSRRGGRKFQSLELLRKAAEIRPSLELRNEAIASLALADLHTVRKLKVAPEGALIGSFDARQSKYAYGATDGTVHVCGSEDTAEILKLNGFEPPFWHLALSPDARFLVIACDPAGSRVEIWELSKREKILAFSQPHFRFGAFSSDTGFVALCFEDANNTIRIIDLQSKIEVAHFDHKTLPYAFCFNPRSPELLLTSDSTPTVRIWNWRKGQIVKGFEHPSWVRAVAWHAEGELFATGGGDHNVRVWNANSEIPIVTMSGHEGGIVKVGYTPDGDYILSSAWDGTFRLWDAHSGRELASKETKARFEAFARDSHQTWMADGYGNLSLEEAASGTGFRELHPASWEGAGHACDFSRDGKMLVSGQQQSLHFWDTATGKGLGALTLPEWEYHPLFHQDGLEFSFTTSQGVESWSLKKKPGSEEMEFNFEKKFPAPISRNDGFLPGDFQTRDSAKIGLVTQRDVRILDRNSGTEIRRWPANGMTQASISPGGELLATWNRNSTNVEIWNIFEGQKIQEIPTSWSAWPVFTPDNQWLIVGDDTRFRAWNRSTWQPAYEIARENAGFVAFSAVSGDSKTLALAISRSTVRVVETRTGRELATLEAPDRKNVYWLALDQDGSQLAAATIATIQLWNLHDIRQELAAMNLDWKLP
jgi:serine/threonine protein kinase/WD40 repeat protein